MAAPTARTTTKITTETTKTSTPATIPILEPTKILKEETFERRLKEAMPGAPVTVIKREIRTHSTGSRPGSRPSSMYLMNGDGPASPASTIVHRREEERREMEQLNDKFADYIQKVRFLQAQNRKLGSDIDNLTNKSHTPAIKVVWESELHAARNVTDNMRKTLPDMRSRLEVLAKEIQKAQEKTDATHRDDDVRKQQWEELLNKLREAEKELAFLRGKIALEEGDEDFWRKQNNWLISELNRVRNDYNHAMLESIDAKNQLDALLEEEKFLRAAHDRELTELREVVENRLFFDDSGINQFRSDLSVAIGGIKNELMDRMMQNKQQMESWYRLRVQEMQVPGVKPGSGGTIHTEEIRVVDSQLQTARNNLKDAQEKNVILERQYRDLRDQLPQLQKDYERRLAELELEIKQLQQEGADGSVMLRELADLTRMLKEEIRIYRILVSGAEMTVTAPEERKGALTMDDVTNRSLKRQEELEAALKTKGETAIKVKTTQSTKHNLKIYEVDHLGRFIVVENIGTEDQPCENLSVFRTLDGVKDFKFDFPTNFTLASGKKVKIYAKGAGSNRPPDDLVADTVSPSWGVGHYCKTSVKTKDGEELANYVQNISLTIPPSSTSGVGTTHLEKGL